MENYKENCRTILKILTGKENVKFTEKGDFSIKYALEIAKNLDKLNCLIQDEGNWYKYEKFINEKEMNCIRLITNYGLIFEKELKHYSHDSVLLLNSLAGYIAMHDMAKVHSSCITNDIFLINDVSGSIGTNNSKFGEIIIGSFGKGKPVDLGHGGFIAVDDDEWFKDLEDFEIDFKSLEEKLRNVNKRREFLTSICKKVKDDLKDFDIVHKDEEGINVVVKFSNEEEKNKILNYCKEHNYEYTMCPREIRIMEDAVSIEIKRL
ncbi:MAG: hypothetical protein AB7V77_04735 [Candidatus Woesearchaeota archaeon]